MAIPTSNISMTGIATELGISTSNISLDSLGDKMIVIDPGSSRQTFTLTDTITLTTDDTSVAANMNTGSGSTQMSEFGGYTKANPIQFSSTNSAVSAQVETVNVFHSLSIPGCPVMIRLSSIIYAKRVGNDLVWYVGEGFYSNFGQHYKEGTQIGTDTEVARLAGVASNTKCGFDFRLAGQSENNNTQQSVVYTMYVQYTVTHPNHVPRAFGFYVGLKGRYTANNSGGEFEC